VSADPEWRRRDKYFERRVAELHAQGWSDRDIAKQMRCSATRARERRLKLGLPSNGHNERHTQKVWARRQKTLKKDGVETLGELVSLSRRLRAAASGWPAETGKREVEILNLLDRVGPKSKNEITNLLGLKHLRSGGSEKRRSYLRTLVRAGLVEVRKEMSSYGPVRRLYAISKDARKSRERRLRIETLENAEAI